nr:hypothetical protein Iba_chr05cCG17580 [Ipomoea batatas]
MMVVTSSAVTASVDMAQNMTARIFDTVVDIADEYLMVAMAAPVMGKVFSVIDGGTPIAKNSKAIHGAKKKFTLTGCFPDHVLKVSNLLSFSLPLLGVPEAELAFEAATENAEEPFGIG